jgi:hypothetical protein
MICLSVISGPRVATRMIEIKTPTFGALVVNECSRPLSCDHGLSSEPWGFFMGRHQSLTGCRHVNREAGRKGMNDVCTGHTVASPCSPEARRALTFWLVLAVAHRRLAKGEQWNGGGARWRKLADGIAKAQGTVPRAVSGHKLLSRAVGTLARRATPDDPCRVTPTSLVCAVGAARRKYWASPSILNADQS